MRDGEEQHKEPKAPLGEEVCGWMLGPWIQGLS